MLLTSTLIHDSEFIECLDGFLGIIDEEDPARSERYNPDFTTSECRERMSWTALSEIMESGNKDRALEDANKFGLLVEPEDRSRAIELASRAFRSHGLIGEKDSLVMSGTGFYPENGYMGWHTNRCTAGVRIYCNWASVGGKSGLHYFYEGRDSLPATLYDSAGWNFRLFSTDHKMPFWHAVWSECDRISVGFRVKECEE